MALTRKRSSVDKHALARWLKAHPDDHGAEVAQARLDYMELEGQARLIRGLVGLSQVRPSVLITAQVSGRWSTTQPPLGGLKTTVLFKLCRPPAGTYWLSGDWKSVEGYLMAIYSQEWLDLDVLSMSYCVKCRHDHTRQSHVARGMGRGGGELWSLQRRPLSTQGSTDLPRLYDRQGRSPESVESDRPPTSDSSKASPSQRSVLHSGLGAASSRLDDDVVCTNGPETAGTDSCSPHEMACASDTSPSHQSDVGGRCASCACRATELGPGDLHIETLKDMFPDEEIKENDPRRQLAKTTRYNLGFAYDYRGILDAKDVGIFGGRDQALSFAQRYIDSRSALAAAKQRVFEDSVCTGEARSAFGRLRRLTGDARTKAKDGWSQVIQGTVSSMMNRAIVRICTELGGFIVFNRHDGAVFQFPATRDAREMRDKCERVFRGPWHVWGQEFNAPSDWEIVRG